jgi:deoxyadenosine/deoxycytidine kinase
MNLDDNELYIYQRLFDLVARDLPTPDLVIYLQTPTDALKRRLADRVRHHDDVEAPVVPSDHYLTELNEAYNHFFFHYAATPLLVVETSHVDLSWGDEAVDELIRQIRGMGKGTRYFVPRTG